VSNLRLPPMGERRVTAVRLLLAFALGIAGGLVALEIGAPLPWLLGSVMTVGAGAMFLPISPQVPRNLRMGFVPVIGVAIGAAFTPDIVDDIERWWPSLAALCVFIPAAHLSCYWALRRGGLDAPTAYWGAVPGGLIESVILGEEAGADVAILTILQFLRLILCIMVIPLGFTIATGEAVGSASGAVIGGPGELTPIDWVVLALCGIGGLLGGRAIGLPAAVMTGPLLVSGGAHLAGLVHGAPPRWLIDLTQLVVGVSLGCRFAGLRPRLIGSAFRLATVNLLLTLSLTGVAALALPPLVGESWEAIVLAFAPGGIAEMSLVALSLEVSILFVTAHHVARIVIAIGAAKLLWSRFGT
jgi:membrane AbrB-like protein